MVVYCNGSRLVAVVKVISERLSFDSLIYVMEWNGDGDRLPLIYFNMSDNINTDANG